MHGTRQYLAGIQKARDQGLIEISGDFEPESGVMPFSNHIDWKIGETVYEGVLTSANTRGLYELIPRLLRFYARMPVRFLELGPGAGNACFEFSLLCEQSNVQAEVCAVSYTPIDPNTPMLASGDSLLEMLSQSPALEILGRNQNDCLWRILTEAAFQLQESRGLPIFGKSERPFIHRQWIGDYPTGIRLGDETFEIVYDMHGPLHRKETAPILDAYSRLSDTGVLFFVFNPKYPPGQIMLEGVRKKYVPIFGRTDSVVVDTTAGSALVAKPESPLAKRFSSKFEEKPQTVPARDIMEFMNWLDAR